MPKQEMQQGNFERFMYCCFFCESPCKTGRKMLLFIVEKVFAKEFIYEQQNHCDFKGRAGPPAFLL